MKIQFCSIGKAHEAMVKAGIEDFTKRVNNYFKAEWLLLPVPKQAAGLSEPELKKKEAALILEHVDKDDFLVLLDERGQMLSSPELAQFIQTRANASTRKIIFLIGGAFGVDEAVKQRAQLTWSLSKLVFPHQLVRLILAEQVYRACTIIRNEKYHHV
ncbi:MAG: 23S rRNA (pseudouridine(1915)-N(3))-methyltransferase RlmH [Sphingobacteriales bacterium SCN 48-20]|jgi:23S rRNA (pseudouridine1915-N3)-methyltransferase|uniref:23S rRNA (pseudouridine(1915)-N(3))-methyltransferase RlmH n=1 Tax=Terrimonas ferruginea TaxID=249 RepID=UPI00086AC502|nr:23S rRNA (pseudouridine(1915)-N(3))-methyltransferase RlmH [Terrimonas ferruginea]MBN8782705.1 23S rRNA (pseudouridine(1915)-N(3))-methyltransferase RlmH [Terrimonas ferruginea]ODT92883.1 MAG: 23S rRNA (pseudouridine(1915)-N(3))-methyltransferase RlmH [Sphingobacteriales bacterium SCN 48-20]OJW43912.1 MAG: 23S rRNA (pseudouridine(1915)-N(3))-methyltransferase RlmH [Sphingobacteriales bacterium 48-107]